MSLRPNTHTLGGLALDAEDRSRAVTNVVGLDDAAEVRLGLEGKAQQDGAWDASGFYGARVIQVEGFVVESSSVAAHQFADSLRALSARVAHDFTVSSPGRGTRSATVRVQAGAVVNWLGDDTFTYVLTVVAPDPLLYGPAVEPSPTTLAETGGGSGLTYPLTYPLDYGVAPGVTPGAVTLPNAGTASYYPTLRVYGPVPNPTVTLAETGDWVHYNGTLTAGQFLEFDMQNRRVLLNGQVSVRGQVSASGNWLAVPPGGGSITWTADAADPAATLTASGFEGAWL